MVAVARYTVDVTAVIVLMNMFGVVIGVVKVKELVLARLC